MDGRRRGTVPLVEGRRSVGIHLTTSQADVLVACRRLLGLGLAELYESEDVAALLGEKLAEKVEGLPWDFVLTVSGSVAADQIAKFRKIKAVGTLQVVGIREAAALARVHHRTVRKAVESGALVPVLRIGDGNYGYLLASVLAWRDKSKR